MGERGESVGAPETGCVSVGWSGGGEVGGAMAQAAHSRISAEIPRFNPCDRLVFILMPGL